MCTLYPDLTIGYARPFNETPIENQIRFISLIDANKSKTLKQLKQNYKQKIESYRECLKSFDIPYVEPRIQALPHTYYYPSDVITF